MLAVWISCLLTIFVHVPSENMRYKDMKRIKMDKEEKNGNVVGTYGGAHQKTLTFLDFSLFFIRF